MSRTSNQEDKPRKSLDINISAYAHEVECCLTDKVFPTIL